MTVVREWLAAPPSVVLEAGPRHLDLLVGLPGSLGTGGNLTNDAHLAALALAYGGCVISYDPDFARFAGVAFASPSSATA